MSAHQVSSQSNQSTAPKLSVLGLLFFMLGTPPIYEVFQRQSVITRAANLVLFNRMILMAAAIAVMVELSTLL
jgi:hypothetical protein